MAQTHSHTKKLILTLTILTILMATLYFAKQAEATSHITTNGDIKIYTENSKTELTTINFPLFTAGNPETQQETFTLQNTANQPVHVSWSITASSIKWNQITNTGYTHTEGNTQKYTLKINQDTRKHDSTIPPEQNTILLKNGETTKLRLELAYTGKPTTAETFTLTITFTATKTQR